MLRIVLDTNCLLQSLPSKSPYHKIFGLIHDDEDDNKFTDCAVASNAKYIVTNDKHYNVLKGLPWPQLAIVNIDEFINMI